MDLATQQLMTWIIAAGLFLLAVVVFVFTAFAREQWDDEAHAGESRPLTLTVMSAIQTSVDTLITDVSRWQMNIDFLKMRLAGVVGTVIKCGQGLGLDPFFRVNWLLAKLAGLKRGSYWFYDSRVHPHIQAKLWADAIKDDSGELPHFADYEENYGGEYRGVQYFEMFLTEFQRLSGLPNERIGVYTGFFYWADHGLNDPWFKRFWLWLAWYGPASQVLTPLPWTQEQLLLWQWGTPPTGYDMGVQSRDIDMNYYVPGRESFEARFGDVEDPTPQTGEEGMYKVTPIYNLSFRKGPSATAEYITVVPAGTVLNADQLVPPTSGGLSTDRWARTIYNGFLGYVAVVHNGTTLCRVEEVVDVAAPVAEVVFTDTEGRVWAGAVTLTQR